MRPIHLLSIVASFTLAACGSKSKGDTAPPAGGGEAPDAGVVAEAPPPDAAPAPDPREELLAAEKAAYDAAEGVFLQACSNCHLEGGVKATAKTLGKLDISAYPFAGEHADNIAATIRKVLGIDGSKPTMPKSKPGSVKGDDLALIAAWADAWDAAEAGGAHGE